MKKNVIDIMIDFETFGRQPNSVPINFAAVAFDRHNTYNPFVLTNMDIRKCTSDSVRDVDVVLGGMLLSSRRSVKNENYCKDLQSRAFFSHFSVMECIMRGLVIEPETQSWWMQQDKEAKDALQPWTADKKSISRVINLFISWVQLLLAEQPNSELCLWAQGSDFDIAKLRYLVSLMGNDTQQLFNRFIPHTSFRDARTAILELGAMLFDGKKGFSVGASGTMFTDGEPNKKDELDNFNDIYARIPSFEHWALSDEFSECAPVMANYLIDVAQSGFAHHSLYDCMRSIYNLWWLSQAIDSQFK